MQAAIKCNNPKPEGFCWRVPRLGFFRGLSPGGSLSRRAFCLQGPLPGGFAVMSLALAPPQGVPSLGVLFAPRGTPGPRQDGKESGRIQRQNSKREPILTRSPPVMGQAPPKAKPKLQPGAQLLPFPVLWRPFPGGKNNCWRVLRCGSLSGFLFQSSFPRGEKIAGASCALAPLQHSISKLLSKGRENCWHLPCPGPFSRFHFKVPFQRSKKFAGASFSFLSRSWANLRALLHSVPFPNRYKGNMTHGPPP